ncbi:hypothetical protein [Tenacibaculum ovolyticum]|uniref:hypothetical protein n=1 Tax=Tenacibaculum ovolyticum TaxID=104270 RepID=UPI003BA8C089
MLIEKMKKEHLEIIDLISNYLEHNPELRFGQALFNLKINEFQKTNDPRNLNYNIRDIHSDNDADILKRIKGQLKWFDLQKRVINGTSKVVEIERMTINEKLHATDLMELFDEMKEMNKEYAQYILKSLKVDKELIEKILK